MCEYIKLWYDYQQKRGQDKFSTFAFNFWKEKK